MENGKTDTASQSRQRAKQRIIAPVAKNLTIAGWLSVSAGVLWPAQAAAIAWAVSAWAKGVPPIGPTGLAAAVFVVCALLRAGLEHRAAALLFEAADQTIARERAALIAREARSPTDAGSASIASLIVQKLPLLQPWITRYHVAMIRVSILPLLLLVLAFSQSWVVGLTLLIAGPLIPVFMALVGMAAEDASKRQMDEIGTMNDMVMDRLSALLDIRLLGATDRAAEDFGVRAENLRARTMAVLRIAFLSSTVLELFSALGVAMVAVFVGFTLLGEIGFGSWGGGLSLGQGLFLMLIAPEFFQPMRELAAAWHDRAAGYSVVAELDALDAADRVSFIGTGLPSDQLDGPVSVSVAGAVARLGSRPVRLADCAVGQGGTLALTGASGAGKTTALAAIAGLVPLVDGKIDVCGHRLNEDTADAWRARIAMMPQRPHFPDETLADWLDTRQSGRDPWPALRLADAADVVKQLPHGLETRLGETGGGVSGGEARRLLLARAIFTGADLILADEPTADLDRKTAHRITSALQRLKQDGRTIIVATHDPDLAAAMDTQVELRS
ncbi:ABC transporter ATP-binding protein/permease [Hoeflea prorocentri]|uniref:ATP-binding cassette domain-containing protein n=1 Tax=Hoeflea prorocentri TaxID=1922333 RepID=A0A9X3UQX5_9HYPH|nr:ATP-binding cassette domain-containing protein [Hoeflea prorocentri]MCY6383734.1 ATP-binding cassette domain-containing protein [Hoeflea prorocentri]MDA5401534.1 ATP-binding cassette domain-containing protein [Hoeflea prorocentri]